MHVQSKLSPIGATCIDVVHPWTKSCFEGTNGALASTILDSLRIYTTVYLLALVARRKIPSWNDAKNTASGIVRSSIFLSVTSAGIMLTTCLLRNLTGRFYFYTVIGIPTFLASIAAILVERPSRRIMLCLYVSNIATETVWRMLQQRGLVKSLKYGEVAIFTTAMTALMYFYRSGDSQESSVLRFLVGPYEQNGYSTTEPKNRNGTTVLSSVKRKINTYSLVSQAVQAYSKVVNVLKNSGKHPTCPHPNSCAYYTVQGTSRQFAIGLAVHVAIKTVFSFGKLTNRPREALRSIFNRKDVFSLALFLGGFAGTFRALNCTFRHLTGVDRPYYAIPSGLAAGAWFAHFPNVTVALYAMWKTMEISYKIGKRKGYLPEVPGFTEFLYCFSTTILFHNAIMEPETIRSSYWTFLHTISGGRMTWMNRVPLDVWGLNTSEILKTVIKKNRLPREVRFSRGIFNF